MGFDSSRFVDEVDAELICSICHGILEDPRQVCVFLNKEMLATLLYVIINRQ